MFKDKAKKWLNEEKERAKYELSDDSVLSLAVGFPVSSASDVIKNKERSFNFISNARRIVLEEIQNNPEALVSLALKNINFSELDEIIDDVLLKKQDLSDLMSAQPKFYSQKPKTEQAVNSLKSLINNKKGNQLSETGLEDIIESDSLLDELTRKNPQPNSTLNSADIYEVSELRDRYYTITSSKKSTSQGIKDDRLFKITNIKGEELQEVFGAEEVVLDIDNKTIIVEGESFNITPVLNTVSKPISPNVKVSEVRNSKASVIEEYSFEIWACYVLDLTEYIIDKIDSIYAIIAGWRESINSILRVINSANIGYSASFQGEAIQSILEARISQVIDAVTGSEILGVSSTFTKNGFKSPGSATVCDINKEKYCNTSRKINLFIEDLDIDLGGWDITFNADVDLFNNEILEIEKYINKIEELLNKIQVDKLKGAVCSFVAKRIRGTPKELSNIQEVLLAITLITIPVIPALFESEKLTKLLNSLEKAGLGALKDLLGTAQIDAFLNTEEVTHPGVVAACLEQYASITESPLRATKLGRLARLARTKDDRITVGRRVRDGMRRRLGVDTDIDNAETVLTVGDILINEVLNE